MCRNRFCLWTPVLCACLLILGSGPTRAEGEPAGADALNFFLGHWDVISLGRQGSVVGKARTHAYEILDGTAIQDDWRQLDAKDEVFFRGTSIRTYVPQQEKWVVHWVMAGTPGYTYIDAVWRDGEFHGTGRGFDGQGEFTERLRYFDITDRSYSFQMERSYDGGKTWRRMSDLRATKRKDAG